MEIATHLNLLAQAMWEGDDGKTSAKMRPLPPSETGGIKAWKRRHACATYTIALREVGLQTLEHRLAKVLGKVEKEATTSTFAKDLKADVVAILQYIQRQRGIDKTFLAILDDTLHEDFGLSQLESHLNRHAQAQLKTETGRMNAM